jgi:hypothetical protein
MSSQSDSAGGGGFGKPPNHTRFKKGQSGNPKGRVKGSKNVATLMSESLNETVVIKEYGQRKRFTKEELMFKQLANKGAAGDPRATQQVIGIRINSEISAEAPAPTSVTNEADRQVLEQVIARIRRSNNGGTDE